MIWSTSNQIVIRYQQIELHISICNCNEEHNYIVILNILHFTKSSRLVPVVYQLGPLLMVNETTDQDAFRDSTVYFVSQ